MHKHLPHSFNTYSNSTRQVTSCIPKDKEMEAQRNSKPVPAHPALSAEPGFRVMGAAEEEGSRAHTFYSANCPLLVQVLFILTLYTFPTKASYIVPQNSVRSNKLEQSEGDAQVTIW